MIAEFPIISFCPQGQKNERGLDVVGPLLAAHEVRIEYYFVSVQARESYQNIV